MPAVQKAKSKGRKIGRNAVRCQQYRIENRRDRNKLARSKRYVARKANEIKRKALRGRIVLPDLQAQVALKRLTA